MSRVYGLHEIDVVPGINENDFRQFVNSEMAPVYEELGWNLKLLKGDRGERSGKYAVLIEIESLEQRDSLIPRQNVMSDRAERWMAENHEKWTALQNRWATFSPTKMGTHPEYTDYVALE